MTPEQAQYFLLMLRMGEYDEYDAALDRLLVEQDPLSPLVLELAFCMSDRRETISVLHNFLLDHPADEAQLMESQLAYVRKKYSEKAMTALQAADYLYGLIVANDWNEPWFDLWQYCDVCELYEDGIISQTVFEQCFEAALLRGEHLDCWALQEEESKQKSLLDKLRDLIHKYRNSGSGSPFCSRFPGAVDFSAALDFCGPSW